MALDGPSTCMALVAGSQAQASQRLGHRPPFLFARALEQQRGRSGAAATRGQGEGSGAAARAVVDVLLDLSMAGVGILMEQSALPCSMSFNRFASSACAADLSVDKNTLIVLQALPLKDFSKPCVDVR